MKIKVPYLISKPGANGATRYFWQPSTELRRLGWRPARLVHPDGRPAATLDEAVELAKLRNAELDAWRNGGAAAASSSAPPPPEEVRPDTVAHVIRLYKESARFTTKAEKTRYEYALNLRIIEAWAGDAPIRAITPELVQKYYEGLLATGKHAKANAVLRVLRILLSFARSSGKVTYNAAEKPGMISTKPRLRIWSDEEIDLFLKKADARGWYNVADAVVYGCYIGQRQGDLLSVTALAIQPDAMGWRIHVRQSKRNARVAIPLHPRAAARWDGARKRRADRGVRVATVLWNDTTGAAWSADTFRHVFAELRDEVARENHRVRLVRDDKGVTLSDLAHRVGPKVPLKAIESGEVVPTIEHLERIAKALECELGSLLHPIHDVWFMDTRDTAVTRYAEAGCTVPEICSLTGHDEASCYQILKHYLALNGEMASSAVAKLVAHEEVKRKRAAGEE